MSERQIVFAEVDLKDLFQTEGTPLEELPIGAEYKKALLSEANDYAGPDGTWSCFEIRPNEWVCHKGPYREE